MLVVVCWLLFGITNKHQQTTILCPERAEDFYQKVDVPDDSVDTESE
jgi:hypothetical protein